MIGGTELLELHERPIQLECVSTASKVPNAPHLKPFCCQPASSVPRSTVFFQYYLLPNTILFQFHIHRYSSYAASITRHSAAPFPTIHGQWARYRQPKQTLLSLLNNATCPAIRRLLLRAAVPTAQTLFMLAMGHGTHCAMTSCSPLLLA